MGLAYRRACLSVLGIAACGSPGTGPFVGGADAAPVTAADANPDAMPVPWWHPRPGEARNWDIQLTAPIDVSAPRTMYELDLWSLVPSATTLDDGDGAPVTVPAGTLAGTIAALHARTPRTVVICRVDTGAWEASRPDAAKFPGHTNPPDRPTPPAAGSVIGWSTDVAGERFLDISEAHRGLFAPLIWKRLDLAQQIGCDGVLADRNDVITSDPGFTISPADQLSWFREVATQAHQRQLSIGMKDGTEIAGLVDSLVLDYDWLTFQRCGEYNDCDGGRPFLDQAKAVLELDYKVDGQGNGVDPALACPRQMNAGIQDGLVKDDALTSAYRVQCTP